MDQGLLYHLFNTVLCHFQGYFKTQTDPSVGGAKQENNEKKHLAHPQAELASLTGTLSGA